MFGLRWGSRGSQTVGWRCSSPTNAPPTDVRVMRWLRYLWPLPVTLLGVAVLSVAGILGARVRRWDGCLVGWGGPLSVAMVRRAGCCMGHVLLFRTDDDARRLWQHEVCHVRQFERWGLLLLVLLRVWPRLEAEARGFDHYEIGGPGTE